MRSSGPTGEWRSLWRGIAGISLALLGAPAPAGAQIASLAVSARANIFAAGHSVAVGGGDIPAAIPLGGGVTALTFAVAGEDLSCCGTAGPHGADGGTNLSTHISAAAGISGIDHLSRNIFLLGVFLGPDEPAAPAPPGLTFYRPGEGGSPPAGALADDAPGVSPALRQTFFIGDGLTAAGEAQSFRVPAGATRLFLGFADGLNLGDPRFSTPSPASPCCYSDNTGSVAVEVSSVDEDLCTINPRGEPSCLASCCAIRHAADLLAESALQLTLARAPGG